MSPKQTEMITTFTTVTTVPPIAPPNTAPVSSAPATYHKKVILLYLLSNCPSMDQTCPSFVGRMGIYFKHLGIINFNMLPRIYTHSVCAQIKATIPTIPLMVLN